MYCVKHRSKISNRNETEGGWPKFTFGEVTWGEGTLFRRHQVQTLSLWDGRDGGPEEGLVWGRQGERGVEGGSGGPGGPEGTWRDHPDLKPHGQSHKQVWAFRGRFLKCPS